jgi:ATP-dependent Lon protease
MVGNFDVDVEQSTENRLLIWSTIPEMRDDTVFMDRIHAFVPGWDFPKLNKIYHCITDWLVISMENVDKIA